MKISEQYRHEENLVQELEKSEGVRLVEDYESTPGEIVGVVQEEWMKKSRAVTALKERINLKYLIAKSSVKGERSAVEGEIKKLEEQLMPLYNELEVISWHLTHILAEHKGVRELPDNWERMPKGMRGMLKKGLESLKIDVSELVRSANLKEEQRERGA